MNIAIIDDISTDAEALKNIAVSYFEKKQIRAEICHFFSAEEFFEDYQPGKFQILFLDIYMDGMTGMEKLRAGSEDSPITASLFLSLPAVISLWKAMM